MADIWLMRHAAYEGHRPRYHAPPDAALTPEGHDQIRRALPLPDGITGIVTSPLLRARQTAEALRHLTGLPILATTDLLAEWHAPTAVQGHAPATYPPAYRAWRARRVAQPDLAYEDGESLSDLHARASHCADYVRDLAEQCQGPILAVSHKLLLGIVLRLSQGPASFEAAAHALWPFAAVRCLTRPSASPPTWIPPDEDGPRLLPCGVLFNAVRVRVGLAPYVLARLSSASGPVIQDACAWTWLVEAGGARGWDLAGAEVVCGEAGVLVPPLRPVPRALPRWILPGATPDFLTGAGALRGALAAFAGGPYGA